MANGKRFRLTELANQPGPQMQDMIMEFHKTDATNNPDTAIHTSFPVGTVVYVIPAYAKTVTTGGHVDATIGAAAIHDGNADGVFVCTERLFDFL